MATISVALAVFNEEKNLDACLASVAAWADEIVIVDGGSTDKTIEVAKKYTKKIIKTSNPPVFHINKQKALDACTKDWILQLDADEVIPEPLKKEIRTVINSEKFSGYYIPRRNFFWGHWMRKGGQYPDYVIRLVRRGYAHFPAKTVHEQIAVDGDVGYLKNPMNHLSYRTNADYWRKADAYTSLTAAEMRQNGVKKNIFSWFLYNIVKPKLTFLNIFFRHKGFMDGWYGFIFAVYSAMHFPIAYKKFTKLAVLVAFFLLFAGSVHAEYILPYPSYMPGNKLYRITRIVDVLKQYWYFGPIAQEKYHLRLADKYLVEAKTLFEYKQYLLGADALMRSDLEFAALTKTPLVTEAAHKHKEVLTALKIVVPENFTWAPEKSAATTLPLWSMIQSSIDLRDRFLL